jgi:hypothetical protein
VTRNIQFIPNKKSFSNLHLVSRVGDLFEEIIARRSKGQMGDVFEEIVASSYQNWI